MDSESFVLQSYHNMYKGPSPDREPTIPRTGRLILLNPPLFTPTQGQVITNDTRYRIEGKWILVPSLAIPGLVKEMNQVLSFFEIKINRFIQDKRGLITDVATARPFQKCDEL